MWSLARGSKAGGAFPCALPDSARHVFPKAWPDGARHVTQRAWSDGARYSVCVFPLARAAEARSKSSRARGPKTRGRLSRVIGPKARGMPLPAAWPKYVWYDFLLCMVRKHVWISSARGQNMCRTLPHSMARRRLVCSPWRAMCCIHEPTCSFCWGSGEHPEGLGRYLGQVNPNIFDQSF